MCRVTYGLFGRASVVMTKSTGSALLDDLIVKTHAGMSNLSGNITIPVTCEVIEKTTAYGKITVRVAIPKPAYPIEARRRHQDGQAILEASFDEGGQITGAKLTQSTGSPILDKNVVDFALAYWRSSGGAPVTIRIEEVYALRH